MKKILLALLLSLLPALVFADEMLLHTDKAGSFTVQYPSGWTKVLNQSNVNFDVTAPDGTAKVQVLVQDVGEPVSAMAFLQEMEKAMGGRTNLVPEANRTPPAEQIQAANGDDGAIGAYRIDGQVVVLQGVSIVTKGNKVYILIQTIQQATRATHGKSVGDIAKSFRITD